MKRFLILVAALMVMNIPSVHANLPVEQDVFVKLDHQFALPWVMPIATQANVSTIQEVNWLTIVKLVLISIMLINGFLFLKERYYRW